MRPLDEPTGARRLVGIALLLALGASLAYVESVLLPSLPIPGVRLGLANIVAIIALAVYGPGSACIVATGRCLIVGIVTGTLVSPVGAMSLGGALASWAIMALLWNAGTRFTPVGWSVAGSAAHVVAQLAMASLIVGSSAVFAYAPLSLSLAVPTGLAVGLVARTLISRLSRPVWSFSGA